MTIWRCDLLPQYLAHKEEIDLAIQRVLSSGRYTLASEVKLFEEEFAGYLGVKHCIGVANATDGLILSLKVLGVQSGDEVITTPFTAIPTVSAIVATGAIPVFVDIDPETFLIDIDKVKSAITTKTKAVIPVHIFGNVVNIEALRNVCGDLPIIEDAAQAHGSKINGKMAGSFGKLGVFSFYPTKNLGGYGDGGSIVTDDDALAEKLRLMRMYGMRDYNHIVINGINSRLDELQAAILRVKLRQLDKMNHIRETIAEMYYKNLNPKTFDFQKILPNTRSCHHVFEVIVKGDRNDLSKYLESFGIQSNVYYLIPPHLQEANKEFGYRRGDMPNAEKLCSQVLAIPMYPELPLDTVRVVIEKMNLWASS